MGHAQKVMDDQYLSVCIFSAPYTNGGHHQAFRHLFGKGSRNLFQDNGKATQPFEHFGISHQFVCFMFIFRTHGISAEFVNRLGGQAQMPHHGDTGVQDAFY